MKNLFNWALRLAVKLALFLFYRKIEVVGKEKLPNKKAVIIVSNHQNALIDPLIIATHTHLKPHFLTRASAFKNPIAAALLKFIRMIPVFRVRDGKENMVKNNETFDLSVSILADFGSILIFAEGGHSHERSLRSLKKGFTRIAFQTLEQHPDLDLVILPIGINYSNHTQSGANVKLFVGNEIPVNPYLGNHEELMHATSQALQPLVTQIPAENYEKDLACLINNSIDLSDPREVALALSKHSKEISPPLPKEIPFAKKLFRLVHWPLWLLSKRIERGIDDHVFYATFKFVIGLVGLPLLYLVCLVIFPLLTIKAVGIFWILVSLLTIFSNYSNQE